MKIRLHALLCIPLISLTAIAAGPDDAPASEDDSGRQLHRRTLRGASDDARLPSIYIVPFEGQVGTDIMSEIYGDVIEDIRQVKPDLVVIRMNCSDVEDTYVSTLGPEDSTEAGMLDFTDTIELVNMFRDELRDVPQVMWVHDSVGMSSTLAMAWDRIYMTPTARLGGLIKVLQLSGAASHSDEDKRAKMIAAWVGNAKAFLIYGRHQDALAEAMIMPSHSLSATWRGREVLWSLDTNGEYIVDGSDGRTAEFSAKTAEDFAISEGTAEDLDDLALLLGYREYRIAPGQAEDLITEYREDWRRSFEQAKELWTEYQKYRGWANGSDALQYLGRARQTLKRLLALMERYPAVERRVQMELGLSKFQLTIMIERLQEDIKGIRSGGGVRGGSGSSGTGGGGRGVR